MQSIGCGGAGSEVFCLIPRSEETQFAKVEGYDRVEVTPRGFVLVLDDAHLVSAPKQK